MPHPLNECSSDTENFDTFSVAYSESSQLSNLLVPSAPFLSPLKTSTHSLPSFWMFSGGRERVHWGQMGLDGAFLQK